MFLSVIIPMHNASSTIIRLLSSITAQSFSDMELLIVDDNSTDDSIQKIHDYFASNPPSFPYKIIPINPTVHCPGNTRQAGLSQALGEWITFIDHDDEFTPTAFHAVHDIIFQKSDYYQSLSHSIINKTNIFNYIVCTEMKQMVYDSSTNAYKETLLDPLVNKFDVDSWLHGKFFNNLNLIKAFDIHFKEDMKYMEDVYFIKEIQYVLYSNEICKSLLFTTYCQIVTYLWYAGETNLNRKNTHASDLGDGYSFEDYGYASTYPWIMTNFCYKILSSPVTDENFRIGAIKSLMAALSMMFIKRQEFIDKYGYNSRIIHVLQDQITINYANMFTMDVPDYMLLASFTQMLERDTVKSTVYTKYYFEDPMVWFAYLKQSVIEYWINSGKVQPQHLISFKSYSTPLYILPEKEYDREE